MILDVDACVLQEQLHRVVGQRIGKICASEVGITIRRDYTEVINGYFQNGKIKGATTEVIYQKATVIDIRINGNGNGSCNRLIENTKNLEVSKTRGNAHALTLRVIKVGRNSDNHLGVSLSRFLLSELNQIFQYFRYKKLGVETTDLAVYIQFNLNTVISSFHYLERPDGHLTSYHLVVKAASYHTLNLINCVHRIFLPEMIRSDANLFFIIQIHNRRNKRISRLILYNCYLFLEQNGHR